jgi:hypothetical protein
MTFLSGMLRCMDSAKRCIRKVRCMLYEVFRVSVFFVFIGCVVVLQAVGLMIRITAATLLLLYLWAAAVVYSWL